MKCPVCQTECKTKIKCSTCGFDQLSIEFINKEDANEWLKNTVIPYKTKYYDQNNSFDNGTFRVTNGVLESCYTNETILRYFPKGITSIGRKAFSESHYLTTIYLPSSVTIIEDEAFSDCLFLKTIHIPNTVISIGDCAFSNCKKLSSIKIPNNVTRVSNNSFMGCNNLSSIRIPKSVTSIDFGAFGRCDRLTSIDIPNSVTYIDKLAFDKTCFPRMAKNSYAERYAIENHFDYKYIEN